MCLHLFFDSLDSIQGLLLMSLGEWYKPATLTITRRQQAGTKSYALTTVLPGQVKRQHTRCESQNRPHSAPL